MKSFKEFCLEEGRGYPTWVKGTTLAMTMRVKSLSNKVSSQNDVGSKIDLISRQNNLLAYLLGLSIAIDTKDKAAMTKARSLASR